MYICQGHLDLVYGKQSEALAILKAWGAEKFASSEFRRAKSGRMLACHVGLSPSHVVDEYEFETLADFEAALAGMSTPQFRSHSDALVPCVVSGSQLADPPGRGVKPRGSSRGVKPRREIAGTAR